MPLVDASLRQLTAFAAVADEGSFIGAADVLGRSQAGISQQIASLERATGTTLFDRPGGSRPVTLTPAGRALLRHARAVLDRDEGGELPEAGLHEGHTSHYMIETI